MPISYVIVWIVLIIVVVGALGARASRKLRAQVTNLAASLGFQQLNGMEAFTRRTPEALRQAAAEQREKLPELVRAYVERSVDRRAAAASCLAGVVDGVQITIYAETRGSGRSASTFTVVRADYPKPLPFELQIGYEGTFTRLGKELFGLSDVEIGDAEFDRAVRIKAADEAGARAALDKPGARDAILGLLALSKSAYATNVCAQWEQGGTHFAEPNTRARIAAVTAVARTLGNG